MRLGKDVNEYLEIKFSLECSSIVIAVVLI